MRIVAAFIFCLLIISCSNNNVKTDNSLEHFFTDNNAKGTFALHDNGTGEFTVYNLKRYRDSAYSPGSSFDIVTALVGLQTGKISNEKMTMDIRMIELSDWSDSAGHTISWTMDSAFRESADFYFQEIARRIGKDTIENKLNEIKYGAISDTAKVVIKTRVDSFWLDNSFKIIPDQQLGFIKKLYFYQLPFSRPYQQMVKNSMGQEDNSNYKLSYKIGIGKTEKGNALTWVSGWIEENNHPYLFVLNFESPSFNKETSIKMLKGILGELGFFKGKM